MLCRPSVLNLHQSVRFGWCSTIAKRHASNPNSHPAHAAGSHKPNTKLETARPGSKFDNFIPSSGCDFGEEEAMRTKTTSELLDILHKLSGEAGTGKRTGILANRLLVTIMSHAGGDKVKFWYLAQTLCDSGRTLAMLRSTNPPAVQALCYAMVHHVGADTMSDHWRCALHILSTNVQPSAEVLHLFWKKVHIFVDYICSMEGKRALAILQFLNTLHVCYSERLELRVNIQQTLHRLLSAFVQCCPPDCGSVLDSSTSSAETCCGVSRLLVNTRQYNSIFMCLYERVVLGVIQKLPPLPSTSLADMVYGLAFYGHGVSVMQHLATHEHVRFEKAPTASCISVPDVKFAWSYLAADLKPPMELLRSIAKSAIEQASRNIPVHSPLILHLEQLRPFLAPLMPHANWHSLLPSDVETRLAARLKRLQLSPPLFLKDVKCAGMTIDVAALVSMRADGKPSLIPWPSHPSQLSKLQASNLPGVPFAVLFPGPSHLVPRDGYSYGNSQVVERYSCLLAASGWRTLVFLGPVPQDEAKFVQALLYCFSKKSS